MTEPETRHLAAPDYSATGWTFNVLFCVARIRATWACDIGNSPKAGFGTGFWIQLFNDDQVMFVTNKHVVDPTLKLGPATTYKLAALEIELRKQEGEGKLGENTTFFRVDHQRLLKTHVEADVATIYWPHGRRTYEGHGFNAIPQEDIADETFLEANVHPMDIASFIGFPGPSNGSGWWDQRRNIPIARTAHIASIPALDFAHPDVTTSRIVLVSGFSFTGSSGSPLLLHQKGAGATYVPPKVIGIMSGHWKDKDAYQNSMFDHTGLSYFTKASAIREGFPQNLKLR